MIFSFIIILLLFQITYYLFFLYYFNKKSQLDSTTYTPSISVIICAKNEAENLKNNIPKIAQQTYSDFEIIVIDDNSTDKTSIVLEQLKSSISNLKSIKISEHEKIGKGKKFIISEAVKIANNEVLVFTDADCFPASNNWLKIMAQHLFNYEIVLGIAPLIPKGNNLVAWLQTYETAQTMLQYISLSNSGNTYMAVGRNMMLRKTTYLQNLWSETELEIASGDDDLLIQKIATSNNTNTCTNANTFMLSSAKENYSQWIQQKIRHFSAGFLYLPKYKFLLSIFLSTKILFYFLALINQNFILLLAYIFFQQCLYFFIQYKYKIRTEWQKIALLDFLLVANSIILGLSNQFNIKNRWK
ncbi:MAG TPA: glycosyltransferase [Chitinophagales bacterium]|nr:glycosyltransferase [Chitinophagales bacterium]HMU98058.1 glycosyltransferase [Chitinophagales bacterium]HMV03548.1 glycosyltransferase [Chitinophagales bacterium]HMW94579.1 glycosyltransferase [Chitinophagales bacterium]HMY42302.1 glycosyltransferase [Chitinophagales bacterium]